MKKPIGLWIASLSVFLACGLAASSNAAVLKPVQDEGGLAVNIKAPAFSAIDQDGKKFKLSDYRGKVVVLDFWGYW